MLLYKLLWTPKSSLGGDLLTLPATATTSTGRKASVPALLLGLMRRVRLLAWPRLVFGNLSCLLAVSCLSMLGVLARRER